MSGFLTGSFLTDPEFEEISKEELRREADQRIDKLQQQLKERSYGATGGPGGTLENRWADVENETTVLLQENKTLREENQQMLQQRVRDAQALAASQPTHSPEVQGQLTQLQNELEQARSASSTRLEELQAERVRVVQISEELQKSKGEIARLSSDMFSHQEKQAKTEVESLPASKETERLKRLVSEMETQVQTLRDELAKNAVERDDLFRKKADLQRQLQDEVAIEVAKTAAAEESAKAAREAQQQAEQEAKEAETRLQDRQSVFDAERNDMQAKLELRAKQLEKAQEICQEAQQRAEEAVSGQLPASAVESPVGQQEASSEDKNLRLRIQELEAENRKLKMERSSKAADDAPATDSLTSSDTSTDNIDYTELVHTLSNAKADAAEQRRAREELQQALHKIEQEFATRMPLFVEQRQEVERLRAVAKQLTQQNEKLLLQARAEQNTAKVAEDKAALAAKSYETLEAHTRSARKEIAALLAENQMLRGRIDASAPIEKNQNLRTLEDIVEQNGALQAAVARLTDGCETAAQRELAQLQVAYDGQVGDLRKEVNAKGEQVRALQDAMESISAERDKLKQMLQQREKDTGSSAPAQQGTQKPEVILLQEQVAAVREEFTKCTEKLSAELREARADDLSTRQELATAKAKLETQEDRHQGLQTRVKRAEQELTDRLLQVTRLRDEKKSLEERLRSEEAGGRDAEALLVKFRQEKDMLEVQLRLETKKTARLEKTVEELLGDKVEQVQVALQLQARQEEEMKLHKGVREELESSCVKKEQLLSEQLNLAEKAKADLQKTVDECLKEREENDKESKTKNARLAEYEAKNDELRKQLNDMAVQLEETKANRPLVRARARTDTQAQPVKPSTEITEKVGIATERLEQQIAALQEDIKAKERDMDTWKDLAEKHEEEMKRKHLELNQLKENLKNQEKSTTELNSKIEMSEAENKKLADKVEECKTEVKKAKDELAAKDVEVQKVLQDANAKTLEAKDRIQTAETISAEGTSWRQKHRDAVEAHNESIKLLEQQRHKNDSLVAKIVKLEQESCALKQETQTEREVQKIQQPSAPVSVAVSSGVDPSGPGGIGDDMSTLCKQELELDKQTLERQVQLMQKEVKDYRARLIREQDKTRGLQSEVRRNDQFSTKLEQLASLEDENRRLKALAEQSKSRHLVERLQELEKEREEWLRKQEVLKSLEKAKEQSEKDKREMTAKIQTLEEKAKVNPLEPQLKELQKEKVAWESKRKSLEQTNLEKLTKLQTFEKEKTNWEKEKGLLDATINNLKKEKADLVKNPAPGNLQNVQKELAQVRQQNIESSKKLLKSDADLKQKSSEAEQLKQTNAAKQKELESAKENQKAAEKRCVELLQAKSDIEKKKNDIEKEKTQLQQQLKSGGQSQALMTLKDKRIQEQEKKIQELEKEKAQAKAPNNQQQQLQQLQQELRVAKERGDKALDVAAKYQSFSASFLEKEGIVVDVPNPPTASDASSMAAATGEELLPAKRKADSMGGAPTAAKGGPKVGKIGDGLPATPKGPKPQMPKAKEPVMKPKGT